MLGPCMALCHENFCSETQAYWNIFWWPGFKWIWISNRQKTVVPIHLFWYSVSSGVEVCLASSNMCRHIRTNAYHWYRRQAGFKFSDKWNPIMKISWVSRLSRWFEALHVQLQLPLCDLWDAPIPKVHICRSWCPGFVYLFQHACQQVCCCIFSCNKWLRHNLKEQIPIWN